MSVDFDHWIARLLAHSRLGHGDSHLPQTDEMGHLRPHDAAFLAWRRASQPPQRDTANPRAEEEPSKVVTLPADFSRPLDEVRLWHSLAGLDRLNDAPDRLMREVAAGSSGPLFDQGNYRTIEAWTEADLCGLHALHRLALRARDAALLSACDRIARWHLVNTQPDNATNRPWAVQVFALLAVRTNSAEPRLYAETMLHNAMVELGRPERIAAEILRDAAEAMQETTGC